MDREKYGFTENTVPIIVKKGKNGELYPYFIGINPPGKIHFSIMPDSWYMLDEKYIYIYVYRNEAVIMKAELT